MTKLCYKQEYGSKVCPEVTLIKITSGVNVEWDSVCAISHDNCISEDFEGEDLKGMQRQAKLCRENKGLGVPTLNMIGNKEVTNG